MLPHLTDKEANNLVARMKELAKKRASDAAESGSMGDGGAANITNQIIAFQAGILCEVPELYDWRLTAKTMLNQGDPDYAEYLRLKDKFE